MKNTDILERIIARLPLPQRITDIDVSEPTAVRFTWGNARYRVTEHLSVEEVSDHLLGGTDAAYLMSALLKMVPL